LRNSWRPRVGRYQRQENNKKKRGKGGEPTETYQPFQAPHAGAAEGVGSAKKIWVKKKKGGGEGPEKRI